jgi:hypothetical protein
MTVQGNNTSFEDASLLRRYNSNPGLIWIDAVKALQDIAKALQKPKRQKKDTEQ